MLIDEERILIDEDRMPIDEGHILLDKNFQMHEVNLHNIEDSPSSSVNNETSEYTGKFKNIQEYIKMK